jgi:hypothetical protein
MSDKKRFAVGAHVRVKNPGVNGVVTQGDDEPTVLGEYWHAIRTEHGERKEPGCNLELVPTPVTNSRGGRMLVPKSAGTEIPGEQMTANSRPVPLESAQPRMNNVRRIEKTVFISYRRSAVAWAQSIFQDLTQHGYDVFFDFRGIASGGFETIILENIKARAHFLVLLTPSALERCSDPADLLRREIETAVGVRRNIVPIILEAFDFGAPGIDSQHWPTLAALKGYNGLQVYPAYFTEAMDRLRQRYLNVPLDTVLHPVSPSAERAAKDDQAAAASAPPVTEEGLREAGQPHYLFTVKVRYQDELEKLEGTRAEEPQGRGSLTIYDGDSVVGRYPDVERWSRQQRKP